MNNPLVPKPKRNHFLARRGVLVLLACLLTVLLIPAIGTTQIKCPITNNAYSDSFPHINDVTMSQMVVFYKPEANLKKKIKDFRVFLDFPGKEVVILQTLN